MIRRSLVMLLVCPLFACASTSTAKSAPKPENYDLYTYHVAVPSVPANESQVVVAVETTDSVPGAVSIHGLVGNAPFELPLGAKDPATFSNEQLSVSFTGARDSAHGAWSLRATTQGKPLELDIHVRYPKGSGDVRALESALKRCTTATANGRPIEAVTTRLAQVK